MGVKTIMQKYFNIIKEVIPNIFIVVCLLMLLPQTIFIRGYFDVEIRAIILFLWIILILTRLVICKFTFTMSEIVWSVFTFLAILGAILNSKELPLDIIQPITWWVVAFGIISFKRIAQPNEEFIKKWLRSIVMGEIIISILSLVDFLNIYKLSQLVSSKVQTLGSLHNVQNFGCVIGSYTFGQEMMVGILSVMGIYTINNFYLKKHSYVDYMLYTIAVLIFSPLLIYSNDRDSVLAVAIAFIIILYLMKNKNIHIFAKHIYVFIFILTGLILLLYYFKILQPFIKKVLTAGTSHRSDIWIDVLKHQKDNLFSLHFLFGDGFRYASSQYNFMKLTGLQNFHSFIIDIWARYGFINLVIIVLYILYGLIKSVKAKFYYLSVPILIGLLAFDFFSGVLITATFRLIPVYMIFYISINIDKDCVFK